MLYALFLVVAILYNLKKFAKERKSFLASLIDASNSSHREMILSHHFYVFIFESFVALIVAHFVTDKSMTIGLLGLGSIYLVLLFLGIFLYQFFIRSIERQTGLQLWNSFKGHLIKELRVSFAVIMLPILIYSVINLTFQDSVYEEWGNLWFIGLLFNILFVSVLTIICSVIIMLRLIPNREISEPEYLKLINRRLEQIGMPDMRIRWIETDIKNAFVVGLKILSFSNQTMFIGKSLRTTLTLGEFDAVIAHELSHVANRHIHKRMIDLLKNFVSTFLGIAFFSIVILGSAFIFWGDDAYLHSGVTTFLCMATCLGWMFFNYSLLFDSIRAHEFEADAYAVMNLGVELINLQTALEKLSNTEELPEYLKSRTKKSSQKGVVGKWWSKKFSTHPDLETRLSSIRYKIESGLPYNHYISTSQKMRSFIGHLFQWRVALPVCMMMIFAGGWAFINLREGQSHIAFINKSSVEEIISNKEISASINSKPRLVGDTLMYHVVKKNDARLIDYFLQQGAHKGRTLIYVSMLKDFSLFESYYSRLENDLSEDEYFMLLRKTAQLDFTMAYRHLVNAKRFEDLNPVYKADVSRINASKRSPASIPKTK